MAAGSTHDETLALVHEGWNHLMSQRPLAAWGSWQRALRRDPESSAARQALQTLESAPDLPLAARAVYRFRKPASDSQRSRWDRVLRRGAQGELEEAVGSFRALTDESPEDAEAWFNQALCLAWSGLDREAVDCLDQATNLEADRHPKRAVESWALAEILRQGGGAESLADDLRYACTFEWDPRETAVLEAHVPELRRIPTPRDPTRPELPALELEVLEWLDRPFPSPDSVRSESDLPRVLATAYIGEGKLRLSSPRVDTLEIVEERLHRLLGGDAEPFERVAAPLPLPFLDADVWTTRMPEELDRELVYRLTREAVESYYENVWIHRPRQSLDGLSPLAAAQDARGGDSVVRSKLAAIVQIREQLGSRPSASSMYQGYPFDRLRRRLELEPSHPRTVDPADLSCAGLAELEQSQADELDDVRLIDAFRSSDGLREDPLTTRFAAELLRRKSAHLPQLDRAALIAPLVRHAMQRRDVSTAFSWLETGQEGAGESAIRSLNTWRAEILARTGRPDSAAEAYRRILSQSPSPAQACLDAGETLADNGHVEHARALLEEARELAAREQVPWVGKLAARFLADLNSRP